MAYPYYQQNRHLGWGTNQFQFGPPPAPNFQPQPSWGGLDYYRAHSSSADTSLFDHAWSRVRDYSGAPGPGVGLHESRHWHRRAYGGLGELNHMIPVEIGHAAAYEAYRTWIHNSSIHEPLSGDIERQREGLIGLAVAEATRLLQYSTRPMDSYARMAASEAAAYTASIIFRQSREDNDGSYRSRSRSHHPDDPYAFDDDSYHRRPRSRSRSRHRTLSSSYGVQGGSYVPAIPIPGGSAAGGYGGNPSSYGGHPASYGSYSSSGGGGGGGIQNYSHSPYGSSSPMQMGASPSYQGSMPSYQNSMPMVIPAGGRSRSTSFSTYGQPSYGTQPTQYMGSNSLAIPPSAPGQGQTIIITKPTKSHRKHKHHHHHHHGKRSRSIEPVYSRY